MTPYGYEIKDGRAVCDPAAAGRIRTFFHSYLKGFSIKEAKERAGLKVSRSTAGKILKNRTYLGDDFYPAIIDRETFDRAAEERERRYDALGRFGHASPVPPVPARDTFRMVFEETEPACTDEGREESALCPENAQNCAKRAAYLYSLIRYDPGGDRELSSSAKIMVSHRMKKAERLNRRKDEPQLKKNSKEEADNVS